MRILRFLLAVSTFQNLSSTAVGQNSYYTGNKYQDSIVKAVDSKLKNSAVKTIRSKKHFGADSIVYYAVNKQTNQLVAIGFTEIRTDSRTMYDLIDGELIRVRYIPNHRKSNPSTIYYYDKDKLIYKRERNADTPSGEKFIDDILFFKKALGTR